MGTRKPRAARCLAVMLALGNGDSLFCKFRAITLSPMIAQALHGTQAASLLGVLHGNTGAQLSDKSTENSLGCCGSVDLPVGTYMYMVCMMSTYTYTYTSTYTSP